MAYQAMKTEHVGAKKGEGSYWGHKQDAKKESSHKRRQDEKLEVKNELQSLRVSQPIEMKSVT